MCENQNEIQLFLEKDFDDQQAQFDEGISLFVKFSKNRNLQNHIVRRGVRELTRLMYNLEQLAKRSDIKASKVIGKKVPPHIKQPIVGEVVDSTAPPTLAGPGNIDTSKLSPEMLVEFNNGKLFAKTAQQYHLKMRDESISPEERANHRKEVILNSDNAKISFGKCSDYIAKMSAEGKPEQAPATDTLKASEISAIRKYVSTKLKSWDKLHGGARTKVLTALNKRIAKMQKAGENFAPETVEKLKNIGVYFGE